MKIVASGTIEDGEEGGWYREMVRSSSRVRNWPGWREEPPEWSSRAEEESLYKRRQLLFNRKERVCDFRRY
jgi:hypothetical protein